MGERRAISSVTINGRQRHARWATFGGGFVVVRNHPVPDRRLILRAMAFTVNASTFQRVSWLHVDSQSGQTLDSGENCSEWFRRSIAEKAANSLKRMAPQAGFEPATLRLTATFFKPAWDHSRRRGPFLLGNSWSGGNPRPPETAHDCPQFVPARCRPNPRVGRRRFGHGNAVHARLFKRVTHGGHHV
jgi:hypothetical protein